MFSNLVLYLSWLVAMTRILVIAAKILDKYTRRHHELVGSDRRDRRIDGNAVLLLVQAVLSEDATT